MNERMKQLAEEAGFILWEDESWKPEGAFIDWSSNYDDVLDRYTELIVQECMDICKKHPSRIVSNNWNVDAVAPHLVQQFEEHFGVEE